MSSDMGNTRPWSVVHQKWGGRQGRGRESRGHRRETGCVHNPTVAAYATLGHSPAVLMPQFPHLALNEHASPVVSIEMTLTHTNHPQMAKSPLWGVSSWGPPPEPLPRGAVHSPSGWGWAEAPAGSATGWASFAELWALAIRFRAELKPGRDPKKPPRVYMGQGAALAGLGLGGRVGESIRQPWVPVSPHPCSWVTPGRSLSLSESQFPCLGNGQSQPASRTEKVILRVSKDLFLPQPPFHRWGNRGSERGHGWFKITQWGKELRVARGPHSPHPSSSLGQEVRVGSMALGGFPPHLGSPSGPQYCGGHLAKVLGGSQALAVISPSHASPYLALGFGRILSSFFVGGHGNKTLSSWKGGGEGV